MNQPGPQQQVSALQNHLRQNPGDGAAWLTLANLTFGKVPTDQLRPVIQKVMQLLPDNSRGWSMMASLMMSTRGATAVREWLEESSERQPGLLGPKLALGTLLLRTDTEQGLAHLEQIATEYPGDDRAFAELAIHRFAVRDYSAAAVAYEKASAAKPDSANYLNNLAACKLELKLFKETIEISTRAIELDQGLGSAYVNRADAKRLLSRVDAAIPDYEMALSLDPDNPVILNKAGACLRLLENLDTAREHFQKALQLAPDFSLARLNIGLLGVSQGQIEEGKKQINQAMADPRLDTETRHAALVTMDMLAEHQRLREDLDRAVEAGQPQALSAVLKQVPVVLAKPHSESLRSLEELAETCANISVDESRFRYLSDTRHLCFLEAYLNCQLEENHPAMAAALEQLRGGIYSPAPGGERNLEATYKACLLRRNTPLNDLLDTDGEAWIRYWHALLLKADPNAFPGQFKFIPNLISANSPIPTVPPEHIQGTLKIVLDNLRRNVPAGIPRAIFMKIVLVKLHAFKDGNGRLARHIFNWEAEAGMLHPIAVSVSCRKHLPINLDESPMSRNVVPMLENMVKIYRENDRLLEAFNDYLENRAAG